jgi:hypothetical protein
MSGTRLCNRQTGSGAICAISKRRRQSAAWLSGAKPNNSSHAVDVASFLGLNPTYSPQTYWPIRNYCMTRKYQSASWIDPRIEIRESPGRGKGSFAVAPIGAGEIVTIWGGQIFTLADVQAGKALKELLATIGEGLYLGEAKSDEPYFPGPDHYLNHSCDPNVWMVDEVTFAARRDIATGEELTADYALWEGDETYVMRWTCSCRSPLCRGRVTGRDWRLRDLQERYRGHFSPFINERIARLEQPERPRR